MKTRPLKSAVPVPDRATALAPREGIRISVGVRLLHPDPPPYLLHVGWTVWGNRPTLPHMARAPTSSSEEHVVDV